MYDSHKENQNLLETNGNIKNKFNLFATVPLFYGCRNGSINENIFGTEKIVICSFLDYIIF